MGEDREFGDAIVEDAREESTAINAGEESFEVADAGSDPAVAVTPPEGERWVDVSVVMRFKIVGDADSDMISQAVTGALEPGDEPVEIVVARDTQFASRATLLQVVKIGGTEQGIG